MTGNGLYIISTYKNGDDWGIVCYCFNHINSVVLAAEKTAPKASTESTKCWVVNVIQKAVFLSHFKSGLEWLLEKNKCLKIGRRFLQAAAYVVSAWSSTAY